MTGSVSQTTASRMIGTAVDEGRGVGDGAGSVGVGRLVGEAAGAGVSGASGLTAGWQAKSKHVMHRRNELIVRRRNETSQMRGWSDFTIIAALSGTKERLLSFVIRQEF